MNFIVKNRYSETNLPDKHGRWARIVYAGSFQIAWISKVWIETKFFYSVTDYFPSVQNDSPCYSVVIDKSLEEVIEDVKLRFNKFISNVIYNE